MLKHEVNKQNKESNKEEEERELNSEIRNILVVNDHLMNASISRMQGVWFMECWCLLPSVYINDWYQESITYESFNDCMIHPHQDSQ